MSDALVIPAMLHGPAQQVQRRVSSAMRQFGAGKTLQEALDAGAAISPASVDGLIVLNGPAPLLAKDANFHVFLPLWLLLKRAREGKVEESQIRKAAVESLTTPWGLLGIISPANQLVVYAPDLHRPILRSALLWWEKLDAVGSRYTVGLRTGARLWDVPTNLKYVLGQLGLTNEQLRAPLPDAGLRAIVPATALGEQTK